MVEPDEVDDERVVLRDLHKALLERRRHELEQANTSAAQLAVLTEIRDEARSPNWFDWLGLSLAAIAALAALGAFILALA